MNRRPRVSVIMVFLDAERFIEEAIASVFAQSYDSWELVLVDDGSSDGSTAIARGWAARHPERVRYQEHPGHVHRGAGAARALGVDCAAGELIAFLDADDVYLPHKLEEQVALLDRNPEAAMLYGRSLIWHGWSGEPEDVARDMHTKTAPRFDTLFRPPELLTLNLTDQDFYPTTCSVLIRRHIIDAVGGFDPPFENTFEDMVLFNKILLQHPVYVSSQCWDRYRRHPGATWEVARRSGRFRPGRTYSAREAFLRWFESYLMKQGMEGSEPWHALQKELWAYRHPRLHWFVWLARTLARAVGKRARRLSERVLSAPARGRLKRRWARWPPVGWIRFGSLRRLRPISSCWGFDRGTPVDRFYIERFLEAHAGDIRGRVLEVGEDTYTLRFGGDQVRQSDVLHIAADHPGATIIADLQAADHVPSDTFDCVILTQTMQYIYDLDAAVRTLHRILKPGGVLLATMPGISETGEDDSGAAWHWSFTPLSLRRLFGEVFPREAVTVRSHGNVLAAIAFLHGIAAEELRRRELEFEDSRYVVSNTLRAVKPPENVG
jgi:glycosyltransferase involved in cell wall biosynthesis